MKKILLTLILILSVVGVYAQVENAFRGSLNIFASSGTDPNFTFTGFFNDQLGKYASSDVLNGDAIYILYEDRCVRLVITNITNSAGGIISGTMSNQDTVESVMAPPNGVGLIMRETENYSFPTTLSGVSEDLLSCIRTKFTIMVDQQISSGAADGNGIISALPLGPVTIQAVGNTMEIDSADIKFKRTGEQVGFFWDYSEGRLGINTSPSYPVDVLGEARFMHDLALTGYVQVTPQTGTVTMKGASSLYPATLSINAANWVFGYNLTTPIVIDTLGKLQLNAVSGTLSRLYGENASGELVYTTSFDLDGTQIYEYNRDSVSIRATDTTVTVVTADGSATINVPSGVTLLSASVRGDGTSLDGSNDFAVVINTTSTNFNTSISNMIAPDVAVISTAAILAGGPSPAAPFIYDEGSSPQRQITALGNGDITVKIIALNAYSNWAIKLNF
jgi:hypothetical protein